MRDFTLKDLDTKVLVYYIVFTLLACSILGSICYGKALEALKKNAEHMLIEKALDGVKDIEERLKGYADVLKTIAEENKLGDSSLTWEYKEEILREQINKYGFSTMGIADLNGHLRLANGKLFNIADYDYFQEALQGKVFISQSVLNLGNEKPGIVIAAALKNREGKITNVIVAFLDSVLLDELLKDIKLSSNSYSYLIINNKELPEGEKTNKVLEVLVPLSRTGWQLGLAISQTELEYLLNDLVTSIIVVTAVILTLGTAGIVLITTPSMVKKKKKHKKTAVAGLCVKCKNDCKIFVIGKCQISCDKYVKKRNLGFI